MFVAPFEEEIPAELRPCCPPEASNCGLQKDAKKQIVLINTELDRAKMPTKSFALMQTEQRLNEIGRGVEGTVYGFKVGEKDRSGKQGYTLEELLLVLGQNKHLLTPGEYAIKKSKLLVDESATERTNIKQQIVVGSVLNDVSIGNIMSFPLLANCHCLISESNVYTFMDRAQNVLDNWLLKNNMYKTDPEGTSLIFQTDQLKSLRDKWAIQIILELGILHRMGIAHGDIHFGNIFFFEDENILQLGDYGHSIVEWFNQLDASAYDRPEQLFNDNVGKAGDILVDVEGAQETDVWSLGLILAALYGLPTSYLSLFSRNQRQNNVQSYVKYLSLLLGNPYGHDETGGWVEMGEYVKDVKTQRATRLTQPVMPDDRFYSQVINYIHMHRGAENYPRKRLDQYLAGDPEIITVILKMLDWNRERRLIKIGDIIDEIHSKTFPEAIANDGNVGEIFLNRLKAVSIPKTQLATIYSTSPILSQQLTFERNVRVQAALGLLTSLTELTKALTNNGLTKGRFFFKQCPETTISAILEKASTLFTEFLTKDWKKLLEEGKQVGPPIAIQEDLYGKIVACILIAASSFSLEHSPSSFVEFMQLSNYPSIPLKELKGHIREVLAETNFVVSKPSAGTAAIQYLIDAFKNYSAVNVKTNRRLDDIWKDLSLFLLSSSILYDRLFYTLSEPLTQSVVTLLCALRTITTTTYENPDEQMLLSALKTICSNASLERDFKIKVDSSPEIEERAQYIFTVQQASTFVSQRNVMEVMDQNYIIENSVALTNLQNLLLIQEERNQRKANYEQIVKRKLPPAPIFQEAEVGGFSEPSKKRSAPASRFKRVFGSFFNL